NSGGACNSLLPRHRSQICDVRDRRCERRHGGPSRCCGGLQRCGHASAGCCWAGLYIGVHHRHLPYPWWNGARPFWPPDGLLVVLAAGDC
ncbi:unnamed protein product, partial [Symbiodinium microadriaticum]